MSTTIIFAICPVCDAELELDASTEVSEIIICEECGSRLVVESISENNGKRTAILSPAPEVEEDWGQ